MTWLLDLLPSWVVRRLPAGLLNWLAPAPVGPPIKYVDENGIGWRENPDYMEPWYEDRGQHETWKREMRISAWRWNRRHEPLVAIDLRDLQLSTTYRLSPAPHTILPLSVQLADACRRLGFCQLVEAAMPDEPIDVVTFWREQEAAVEAEIVRQQATRAQLAATWNEMQGPLSPWSPEETRRLLSVGPLDGAPTAKPRAPLTSVGLSTPPSTIVYTRSRSRS